jgi:epsilon-lactone hydrolase
MAAKSHQYARNLKAGAAALTLALSLTGACAQEAPMPLQVDGDGTVHVPAMVVPLSEFISPEGKAYLTDHLKDMQTPSKLVQDQGVPRFMKPYIDRLHVLYAVDRQDTSVAGVHTYIYTPKNGIAPKNKNRVLINLHGGGFQGCFPGCAEAESIPIAALGQIKVVSVDYRQAPKAKFPAASEDVAAVYRELLKTYRPENIGIYGCSAGGRLTGMSLAWFQTHGLPRPAAAGMFCGGLMNLRTGFGGDGAYMSTTLGEGMPPRSPTPGFRTNKEVTAKNAYLVDADPMDPMVSPAVSQDVLAKFPPMLVITGTRGFELSNAVYSHTQLVKAGVEADLHVWEGFFHGFFYNPDVPESRDCYDVIVKFFDRHLGQ